MRSLQYLPPKWPSVRRRKCAEHKTVERVCDLKSQTALSIRLLPMVLAFAVVAGCNRNSPPAQPQSAPAAAPAPAARAPAPVPQPPAIPPGAELPVSSVDSVTLNRAPDSPNALIIDVTGTIPSGGWTNPRLVQDTTATDDPSVQVYKFVATSPNQTSADQMPQMVDAELRIDSLPAQVKTVRVVAGGNQISAPVAE